MAADSLDIGSAASVTQMHREASRMHGVVQEEYARRLAGHFGVPDFVYRPAQVERGQTGRREVSDGLLVAGDRGLILQVKSRLATAAAEDGPDRAARWLLKHEKKAFSQAEGSRRTLREGARFVSLRGYERELVGGDDWPTVILLDHPTDEPVRFPERERTVQMSLRDWGALHYQLRSTAEVLSYVDWVLDLGLVAPFGCEFERYRRVAALDAAHARSRGGFPRLVFGELSDGQLHAVDVFDELVRYVADSSNVRWDSEEYLGIVEVLDSQAISVRAQVGAKIIAGIEGLRNGRRSGFFAIDHVAGDRLVFYFDTAEDDEVDESEDHAIDTSCFGALRHEQALESGGAPQSRTLAVGVRHGSTQGWRYSFALLSGATGPLPGDVRAALEADHGVLDQFAGEIRRREFKRNERCPCGSGMKIKRCHPDRMGKPPA